MTINDLVIEDAMKLFRRSIKQVTEKRMNAAVNDGDTNIYNVVNLASDCCEVIPSLMDYFISKYEEDIGLIGTPNKFRNGIAGIRSLLGMRTESYFTKMIVNLFKLNDISTAIDLQGRHLRAFSRTASTFERSYRKYLSTLEDSIDIATRYNGGDAEDWYENSLVRAYASHKTFSSLLEFDRYIEVMNDFVEKGFEVFIESPINLYVKLNKDSLTAVLKLLSQHLELKPLKLTNNQRMFSDLTHDIISDEASDGGLLDIILLILKESLMLVCNKWEKSERVYRSAIGKNRRDDFLYSYEKGEYFTSNS